MRMGYKVFDLNSLGGFYELDDIKVKKAVHKTLFGIFHNAYDSSICGDYKLYSDRDPATAPYTN